MTQEKKTFKQQIYRFFNHMPVSGWLLAKIRYFEARITALEKNSGVRIPSNTWNRVDLLDFGPVSVFMYVDDLAYQNTDINVRNYSVSRHIQKMESLGKTSWSELATPDRLNLLPYLCQYYQKQKLPFTFIDVGCQYGAYSLFVAHIFRERGWHNRIIAFDIGVARHLVDYNIELNRQQERVSFEPLAVTDHNLPIMVFTEMGHSENNRVVNRDLNSEYESYLVHSTTIDDYLLKNDIDDNLIIKVDAQGGEFEIWRGMQRCVAERRVSALFEFTPHALASRVSPLEFITDLSRDAWLIDVPPEKRPAVLLEPSVLNDFTAQVAAREIQTTDVLLIPKKLAGSENLCKELLQGINA